MSSIVTTRKLDPSAGVHVPDGAILTAAEAGHLIVALLNRADQDAPNALVNAVATFCVCQDDPVAMFEAIGVLIAGAIDSILIMPAGSA